MTFSTSMQAGPIVREGNQGVDSNAVSCLSVLMIVNFESDSDLLRETACAELVDRGWQPVDFAEVDGYVRQITGDFSDGEVTRFAERDAGEAAAAAGIDEWDAVCILSPSTRPEPAAEHQQDIA